MSLTNHKKLDPKILLIAITALLIVASCGQHSQHPDGPAYDLPRHTAWNISGTPRMPNSTTTTIVAPGPPRSAVSTNIKFPATPGPVSLPLPKRIQDYNSTANMYLLISGKHHPESSTLTALGQARAYKDITQVTPSNRIHAISRGGRASRSNSTGIDGDCRRTV